MSIKSLLLLSFISATSSAIIPLPSPPNPIPAPPTVDDSRSLTSALEITSSEHHLPTKASEKKVSRNRVRLHSHNSKVSRTREVEILSEKCNDEKLQQIMQDAMTPSLSTSKMVISERATRDFGENFDVICARGHFSYYVEAESYCELTRNNITCLAYKPTSELERESESNEFIDITEQVIKNRGLQETEEEAAKLNR